jgi:transposase
MAPRTRFLTLPKKKIKVGRSALAAYLSKLGLSFKKNPARQ